jgi:aminodeoxyfutalosine synthase
MEVMTPQELLETPDLIAVGVAGDEVRRRMHGAKTTFVRVFEIHIDAPPAALPPRTHAGEFRIVGTPRSVEHAVAVVKAAKALAGNVPVTGFSLADLATLDLPLDETCAELQKAGLLAVAHAPLDLLDGRTKAIEVARAAGLAVNVLSVNELSPDNRLRTCERAKALQGEIGGFVAFAPLPRVISPAAPTTGYDDVKTVSLARTVVTNIPSIQVDWALYGPKLAQVALTVGANDIDNVAAVDPGILGTRRSPLEEIKGNITAAALQAVERDGLFRS